MRSFEENLRLYARLVVTEGVGLAPGQELLIVGEVEIAPFIRIVAEEAYRAGAKNVEVLWRDANLSRVRLEMGSEAAVEYAPVWLFDAVATAHRAGAARLGILSADPQIYADISADRVGRYSKVYAQASRPVSDLVSERAINWCLIGAASEAWAARVFPEMSATDAVSLLWDKIFLTARVFEAEPIRSWVAHSQALEERVRVLNALKLEALLLTGPGTDLRIGLVDAHNWAGGRAVAKNGIRCSPNIPTEEVLCMPHRDRVDGIVTSTKPLSVRGQIVEGMRVKFENGIGTILGADRGEEVMKELVSTDSGACRLGEVALVPNSSKVSETGTLFFNSLYDENAASHIAFGACYEENMTGFDALSSKQRIDAGANDSSIHVDWMIGSGEMDVDGLQKDGTCVPLMRSGEWV